MKDLMIRDFWKMIRICHSNQMSGIYPKCLSRMLFGSWAQIKHF